MKRDACIDFFEIPDRQMPMHIRLSDDWTAYCHGSTGGGNVSPTFRLYRSDEHWEPRELKPRGDAGKGAKLNAHVNQLPERHRLSLQWYYIVQSAPIHARRLIGCSSAGLRDLVIDGRWMLMNRGA